MGLELILSILDSCFDKLETSARAILVDLLIKTDSPEMWGSVRFYPDLLGVLEKVSVDSVAYRKVCSKYLALQFSTDIETFLAMILKENLEEKDIKSLLRFFDTGL